MTEVPDVAVAGHDEAAVGELLDGGRAHLDANETFGPVISLYRFHDEADAIAARASTVSCAGPIPVPTTTSRFGARVLTWPGRPRDNLPLRTAGALLAQSVPLMLVLFVFFPRVQGPLWGLPDDAYGGRTGLSDSMSPGEIASLADVIESKAAADRPKDARSAMLYIGQGVDKSPVRIRQRHAAYL